MKIPAINKILNIQQFNPYAKNINANWEYLYVKSCHLHHANIMGTQPERIEKYFEQQGIPATFRAGSEYAKKFVAYCCYQASEIFKQLRHVLPSSIDMYDFSKLNPKPNATALTTYGPMFKYPVRTVLFNTFEEKLFTTSYTGRQIPLNWENFFEYQVSQYRNGSLSTPHFLSPFLHEFAHSLHDDNLFRLKGCHIAGSPYKYEPKVGPLMEVLNKPISELNPNLGQTIENIRHSISIYGGTTLPETFAEYYTNNAINNMDLFSLRLTSNPFKFKEDKNILAILSEAWDGLVGDGKGLV